MFSLGMPLRRIRSAIGRAKRPQFPGLGGNEKLAAHAERPLQKGHFRLADTREFHVGDADFAIDESMPTRHAYPA